MGLSVIAEKDRFSVSKMTRNVAGQKEYFSR
jgi:hypothetical protein